MSIELEEPNFDIGERIKAARKSLNLRQMDLAERVGMSSSHLSMIENNTLLPTIATLHKIAQALHRPLDYFVQEAVESPRALGAVIHRMSIGEMSAAKFAELVHTKSGGELSVQIYFQFASGKAVEHVYEQVRGVAEGSIHMFIDDMLSFEHYAKLCGVVFLPYFFRDREQYQRFLASDLFAEQIVGRLLEQDIHLLNPTAGLEYGGFELLFSREPVFTPAAIHGRRFRSYGSPYDRALRRALGAEPVQVAWDQGADALAQEEIDLFLMPAAHLSSLPMHSVARYATLLNYAYTQNMVVAINDRTYRSLSPDVQRVLVEAVAETDQYFSQVVTERARRYLEVLSTEHGVPVIAPDPSVWRRQFRAALHAVCSDERLVAPELYAKLQPYMLPLDDQEID